MQGTNSEAECQRLVYPYIRSFTPWEFQGKRREWLLDNARRSFANQHFQLDQGFRAALLPILHDIAEQQKFDLILNRNSVTPQPGNSKQPALGGTTIIFHTPPLDITELVAKRLREKEVQSHREQETKR
jgi:hypothetical protein